MMRLEDWPERLHACLRKWERVEFVREKTDCVEFAIDVIGAITARQIVNPEQGNYTTEQEAARCVLRHGKTFKDAVSSVLGDSIRASFAQRGDIVLRGNNLGVCVGERSMFRSVEGLVPVLTLDCECAWRIE